ncbi:unnamed protein product [Coregonus sp. 'balchen']|nr:unnamed protein product [Coregonus sp. 'balchen']
MVAIQNRGEISHLNSILPRQVNYYWIGSTEGRGEVERRVVHEEEDGSVLHSLVSEPLMYHGECVETINSHRCECLEGFYGEQCEHAVECKMEEVTVPDKASVSWVSPPKGISPLNPEGVISREEGDRLSSSGG